MRARKRERLKRSIYPKLVINEMEMSKRRVLSLNNRLIERILWDNNSKEVMAWSMMADGRFYEAMRKFEDIQLFFERDNRTLEYIVNRYLCLMELGRDEEGEKEFKKLVENPRGYGVIGTDMKIIDSVMLVIAMREFLHERYKTSLEVYEEILHEQENDFIRTYTLKGIGEIYEKLGRVKEAQEFYYKAWEDGGDLYSSRCALDRLNKLKLPIGV